MIENLTPYAFSAYGFVFEEDCAAVRQERALGWQEENRTISKDDPEEFLQCTQSALMLSCTEGMTALCVALPGEAVARAYYLDKEVQIKAGVCFCLRPLGKACQIRCWMPENGKTTPCQQGPVCPPLTISARVAVQSIHTLFDQEKPKGFYFRGEKHAPYELMYVEKGSMHCILSGVNHLLTQGDLLLCAPQQWHIQYADPDEAVRFITVSFDLYGGPRNLLPAGEVLQASSEAVRCLQDMLAAQRTQDVWAADRIVLRLEQVLLTLVDRDQSGKHDIIAHHAESHLVDQGLHYIEHNLARPLTVAQVAQAVSVSPSYLAVVFQKHLQMSPLQAIHKLKMEEGRRLIQKGEMNISQVAQHLGFATLQHFSRRFKAYFGMSPREYARVMWH